MRPSDPEPARSFAVTPIGVARTPFGERRAAPRQPYASDARGTIELFPIEGIEHALVDLDAWDHVWILFWFDRNEGWRPKVLPPRSRGKRVGVLATRSPYRPNPIGLSVVRLERVEGRTLYVVGVDMLDGSPVLDIKPYVPFADAHPDASSGWLARDPEPDYEVVWSSHALEQIEWLRREHAVELFAPIAQALALGPQPHPYRRIRPDGAAMRLAYKDWRARFRVEGRRIEVLELRTGYRARDLVESAAAGIGVHRAFVERYPLC